MPCKSFLKTAPRQIERFLGNLTAEDYEDAAADPRIDALRDKMQVNENERFSEDNPHAHEFVHWRRLELRLIIAN